MFYYLKNRDNIEKYFVNFDNEELENLKIEIINNCSEIIHHEYDGIDAPAQFDYLRIRNYKEKFVGIKESRDSLQIPDYYVYHFSYDEYVFPDLVYLIDELLKGDNNSIDKILNYGKKLNGKSISDTISDRIDETSRQLDNIDNLDIVRKKSKLEELNSLIKLKEINEKQASIESYYIKLKNLITFNLIDKISIKDIERVNNFFENKTNLEEKIKKLKK